ncbi:MAG: hypothetical protein SFZ02_06220 [bacterium]|nr:hypothetical protein [bacterium]
MVLANFVILPILLFNYLQFFACRRAVNHPSVIMKPRERGCFACFYHKKSACRRGMTCHAQRLSLVTEGLPWQTPTSCLSTPQNRHTNPIYGVLVAQAGGSPPAVSQKFAHFYRKNRYVVGA